MDRMTKDDAIVVVEATRSIVGSESGSLKNLTAAQLGGHVVEGLLKKVERRAALFSREMIDQFIVGNCVGSGVGQNLPRQIAHQCQMEQPASAFLVNEMCGSSLEALILGIQALKVGDCSLALVGGVENISQAPYFITREQKKAYAGPDRLRIALHTNLAYKRQELGCPDSGKALHRPCKAKKAN